MTIIRFRLLLLHQTEEKDASASFFHAAGFGHSRFRKCPRFRKREQRLVALFFYTEDGSPRWNF